MFFFQEPKCIVYRCAQTPWDGPFGTTFRLSTALVVKDHLGDTVAEAVRQQAYLRTMCPNTRPVFYCWALFFWALQVEQSGLLLTFRRRYRHRMAPLARGTLHRWQFDFVSIPTVKTTLYVGQSDDEQGIHLGVSSHLGLDWYLHLPPRALELGRFLLDH